MDIMDIEESSEIIGILDKISLLGGLNHDDILAILPYIKKTKIEKDKYIFKQGDPPEYIYILTKGQVKLISEIEQVSFELIEYGIGASIGETALIGIQKNSASAYVTVDCECLLISRGALMSLYKSHNKIFGIITLNIAREACRRLSHSENVALHYFYKKEKGNR